MLEDWEVCFEQESVVWIAFSWAIVDQGDKNGSQYVCLSSIRLGKRRETYKYFSRSGSSHTIEDV